MEHYPEYEPEERDEVIRNFEKMLKKGDFEFMDQSTFEFLIEHYAQSGDMSKALTVAKIGHKQHPFSVELMTEVASLLIETGRGDEAEEYLDKAETYAPTDPEVMTLRGLLALDQESFDEAIDIFNQVLPFSDDPSEIYYHLGMAYFGKEENEKAVENFKNSVKADTKNEDAIYDMINVLDTLDMLEESIPFYEEFIDINPYDAVAWYNLGLVYDRLFNADKAIECYDYAVAIQENYPTALFNLACAHMSKMQYSQAIESFRACLKSDFGDDAMIFVNIGMCLLEMNETNLASKEFHTALNMNASNHAAYFGLARCLEKQEKWMEAIHFLKKSISFFDKDINVWLLLAKCEYSFGNSIAAITALKTAADIESEVPEIWLDWSYILSQQGDYEQALGIIDKGIDLLPEVASLYYRAVVYLIKQSKYKEAFIFLENALTLDFEKHHEMFEFFPELETQKALMKIIDQFSKGDVQ